MLNFLQDAQQNIIFYQNPLRLLIPSGAKHLEKDTRKWSLWEVWHRQWVRRENAILCNFGLFVSWKYTWCLCTVVGECFPEETEAVTKYFEEYYVLGQFKSRISDGKIIISRMQPLYHLVSGPLEEVIIYVFRELKTALKYGTGDGIV